MGIKPYNLQSLAKLLNGKISLAFDKHSSEAVKDCIDRPHVKKARKVTIVIEYTPGEYNGSDGELETVDSIYDVSGKFPSRRSGAVSLGVMKGGKGGLFWSEHSQENFNQKTIPAMDEGDDSDAEGEDDA